MTPEQQGEPERDNLPHEPIGKALVSRRRVLVAEDNELNQLAVAPQLSALGYEATIVSDGPTALAFLRTDRWDVVLLDVQLPGMDGLEVARRYRDVEAARPRVPIIGMSASTTAGDRDACRSAGMDDCLTTPVGIEPLRAVLDRWVEGSAVLPMIEPARPRGSLDALVAECGGDRDAVVRMVTTFLDEFPQRRMAVEHARDAAGFASAVHALGSASAALSLTGLCNACRAAEQAAQQGRPVDRVTHEQAIDAAGRRSVQMLQDWLDGDEHG